MASGNLITATTDLTNTRQVRVLFHRICEEVLGIHYMRLPSQARPKNISKITADDLIRLVDFYALDMKATITYDKYEQNYDRIGRGQKKRRKILNPIELVPIEDVHPMKIKEG